MMFSREIGQQERERLLLAPYAMHSADSAGRVHQESAHLYRNAYQRDRDRIVHSSAFRRLAHKTQVFLGTMGDYHRSRLTHTLEVTSIARTIGRTLQLNEDLIEPLALMHDIGHPPFGHAGEDVLNECLSEHGGFNHNAQALRIVELLEHRYPNFPGLNLTREVLSGQRMRSNKKSRSEDRGQESPLLEVQVVDAADSIAYDAHDPDDAIEMGLLTLGELADSQLWRDATKATQQRYTALDQHETRRAVVHAVIDRLAGDLLTATQERIGKLQPGSTTEVQSQTDLLVAGSTELVEQQRELESLLFERVYRHPEVLQQRKRATETLQHRFEELTRGHILLPENYLALVPNEGLPRVVADFLASMTDRSALDGREYGDRENYVTVATIGLEK
ncbi:dGTP triphosphohydrolase [Adhaeretor mobilis]|uniref:Deoxyguanosinetriphosphate triphosphohydrolase-like protein n=1 Tax=Adhaeretor mobilis TaxID=1930276 RepID=A0A517MR98_9BACT|nr:dNTP triphosphohydrolase [Adhaeretor mobilis]QDS97389.1 Deoxyguanosinetriphosphate triphosphohydrolase [Adhaeretor mobilis]